MIDTSPLSLTLIMCCLLIALFYLYRLGRGRRWLRAFDVENEIGHGMMAVGMIFMLVPGSVLSPSLIYWNMLVFAGATLWWTVRLLTHKPVLALVWRQHERCSPAQSDALHILMHAGMCYMFLLMSSMAYLAICLTCLFFVAFAHKAK